MELQPTPTATVSIRPSPTPPPELTFTPGTRLIFIGAVIVALLLLAAALYLQGRRPRARR